MKVTGEQIRQAFIRTVRQPKWPGSIEGPTPIGGPVDDYTITTSLDLNELARNLNEILGEDHG